MANRLLFTVPNPWPVIRLAERISLSASYECQGVTGERARAAGERWCSRNFRRLVDKKKKKKRKRIGEGGANEIIPDGKWMDSRRRQSIKYPWDGSEI